MIIQQVTRGAMAMLPLSLVVLPWGLLTGALAMDAGLTQWQGATMSLFVFAGAAQLVALGLFKSGAGLFALLLTTAFITSRHLLYSLTMRQKIKERRLRWRLTLGFLLTDELFAICGTTSVDKFDPWYAFGAGFSFYIAWNLSSLAGIFMSASIPNLADIGLDFAIAAIFIALVMPLVKSFSVSVTVLAAIPCSVILEWYEVPGAIVISSLIAMSIGFLIDELSRRHE